MHILILYGTTEGQTRKIAQFVAHRLVELRHTSSVIDAADPVRDQVKLHDFDAVIVSASLHIGRFQASVFALISARNDR